MMRQKTKKIMFLISLFAVVISFLPFNVVLAEEELPSGIIKEMEIKIPFGDLPTKLGGVEVVRCDSGESCPAGDKACEARRQKSCVTIPWLAMYISAAYRYAVTLGSLIAVLTLMMGGVFYISGKESYISKGKEMMVGSVTGLVFLIGSYSILHFINPDLLKLKAINIEIVKQQENIAVSFCSEIKDISNYTFYDENSTVVDVKKLTCGKKYSFISNDPKIVKSGECVGDFCLDDSAWCMPTCDTLVSSGYCSGSLASSNYACHKEFGLWGIVTGDPERYLDHAWVYKKPPGNPITSTNFSLLSIDPGKDTYIYAFSKEKLAEEIEKVSTQDIVLLIELNDSTAQAVSEAYNTQGLFDKGLKFVAQTIGPSLDDEYQVLPGAGKRIGQTGMFYSEGKWAKACSAGICAIGTFKGPESYHFATTAISGADCKWLDTYYFSKTSKGIRLDINVNNFRENTKLDCDYFEKNTKVVGTKEIGKACSDPDECISGDCESVGGIKQCECNETSDCYNPKEKELRAGADANLLYCKKEISTWNICTKGLSYGMTCNTSDSKPCIGDMICQNQGGGVATCACTMDNDCVISLGNPYLPQGQMNLAKCQNGKCLQKVEPRPVDWMDTFGPKGKVAHPDNKCKNNSDCFSDLCVNGVCMCDKNDQCHYSNTFCNNPISENGFCVKKKEVGEECNVLMLSSCVKGSSCKMVNFYKNEPAVPRCSCDSDEACPNGERCIKHDQPTCGYNYCHKSDQQVLTVDKDFDSTKNPAYKDKPYWGLCKEFDDCSDPTMAQNQKTNKCYLGDLGCRICMTKETYNNLNK